MYSIYVTLAHHYKSEFPVSISLCEAKALDYGLTEKLIFSYF